MKIEVGNYINKGLFQFGFGILLIKTEVTMKIVIDFLCFYFEISLKTMKCLHENCKIKAIKNKQYCWKHIGLYYPQKIRDYDPDEEDRRIKNMLERR